MADQKNTLTDEAIAALLAENAALKEAVLGEDEIAALRAENAALKDSLENAAATGQVAMPVAGTFSYEVEDTAGKKKVRKYRFRNGRVRVALDTGEQVPSEVFLRVANGGKPSEKEISSIPLLRGLTTELCRKRMIKLIEMGANIIEEVK